MKTIFFLLVFSFLLGNSIQATNNNEPDCTMLALNVFDSYHDNGYSYEDSLQHMNWAYDGCVNNGGYPGEVVIIE